MYNSKSRQVLIIKLSFWTRVFVERPPAFVGSSVPFELLCGFCISIFSLVFASHQKCQDYFARLIVAWPI